MEGYPGRGESVLSHSDEKRDPLMRDHEVMTREEVAKMLRVEPTTIAWMTKMRKIPSMRVGKHRKYIRSHVMNWLEQESRRSIDMPVVANNGNGRVPDYRSLRKALDSRQAKG